MSSFVSLLVKQIIYYLWLPFYLLSSIWQVRVGFVRRVSLGIVDVRGKLNQEAEDVTGCVWTNHVVNQWVLFLALNPPLYFYNWLWIQRIWPYLDPITLHLRQTFQTIPGLSWFIQWPLYCMFHKNANIPWISEKYADANRQNIVK